MSCFIRKNVCCVHSFELPHRIHSTYHYFKEDRNNILKLSPVASGPDAMINPRWLELPVSRTNFYGPKDVRSIEVRL